MISPLFDSHCHLTDTKFDVDREKIINDAEHDGLFMITVGASYEESLKAIALANKYPKNIWAAVGIHPEYANDLSDDIKALLENILESQATNPLAGRKKVVAAGECGLDYSNLPIFNFQFSNNLQILKGKTQENNIDNTTSRATETTEIIEKQKWLFKIQLDLALKYGLPVIMHLRNKNGDGNGFNAYQDALEMLDELPQRPKGVVHFFQGGIGEAQDFLKRGFYLGFDGYITFDNRYDNLLREIPMERILIETDAPYVAPVPFRGQRNEPKFVEYVLEKIAKVRNISIEEVSVKTYNNTREIFKIERL